MTIFTVKSNNNLRFLLILFYLINDIRFSCQFRRRNEMFRIIFINLTTYTQFYFVRKLYLLSIEIKTSYIISIHFIRKWKFLIFHPILITCFNHKFPLCIQTIVSLHLWCRFGKWIFFRPSLQLIKPCRSSFDFELILINLFRGMNLGLDFFYLQIVWGILGSIKTDRIWMVIFHTAIIVNGMICQTMRGKDC